MAEIQRKTWEEDSAEFAASHAAASSLPTQQTRNQDNEPRVPEDTFANLDQASQSYSEASWDSVSLPNDLNDAFQRVEALPMAVPSGPKACVVCAEEKSSSRFPLRGPTSRCEHEPNTCLDCLETHIETQIGSNAFNEDMIKCPECSQSFAVEEVQRYAGPAVAELFLSRATDSAID